MNAADLRVGWCPGALRPAMAGDGLLVRIKPRGGRLSVAACRAVTALATRYGNGVLNITGRANLQLRGASEGGMLALTGALDELGLLDPTPQGEAARNLVVSPLAGQDPTAVLDIGPLVAALEQALACDPVFWRLPAKFAWSIDDGGALNLASVPADVRFTAVAGPHGPRLAIRLGAATDATADCGPDQLVATAAALAVAFLDRCAVLQLIPHRMGDLTRRGEAGAILAQAGLSMLVSGPPADAEPPRTIGHLRSGDASHIGVAPPFGRLQAAWFDGFAAQAAQAGARDIRLTPWRTLLATDLIHERADTLLANLAAAGRFITDPTDPRLAVAACSGAPACQRATVRVQEDAARLVGHGVVAPGIAIHVSGCVKGCARAQAAPLTLVGRDGRYDVVRDGKAGDPPFLCDVPPERLAATLAALREHGAPSGHPIRHQDPSFESRPTDDEVVPSPRQGEGPRSGDEGPFRAEKPSSALSGTFSPAGRRRAPVVRFVDPGSEPWPQGHP